MSEQLNTFSLTDLTRRALFDVATDLTSAVRATNTNEMLYRRHLPGVVRRHQDESASLRALFRAKSRILHDGAAVSVVFDEARGRYVGMGSLMRGLPLREPTSALAGLLPTKITRRSELLSRQQFTDGPNITAWLDARYKNPADLANLYAMLAKEGGNGSWTIEPVRSDVAVIEAITMGGLYKAAVAPMRYDDNEWGYTPPRSNLYLYQPCADDVTF